MPTEERLVELETKLTFCEDQIDALNTTIFRQQQQMDLLQEQIRVLYEQMRSGSGADRRDLREEIPPHY